MGVNIIIVCPQCFVLETNTQFLLLWVHILFLAKLDHAIEPDTDSTQPEH